MSSSNPWLDVQLSNYENHMRLESVHQLQALNLIMREQFASFDVLDIMILGVAGGNGLEHIDPNRTSHVYGVDLNESYLQACSRRHQDLGDSFTPLLADISDEAVKLPSADLVVANLFIEYVGYEAFTRALRTVDPEFVSCALQVNEDDGFVSESPYGHVFKDIVKVYHHVDEASLTTTMASIGYTRITVEDTDLPNGKKLRRSDYQRDIAKR